LKAQNSGAGEFQLMASTKAAQHLICLDREGKSREQEIGALLVVSDLLQGDRYSESVLDYASTEHAPVGLLPGLYLRPGSFAACSGPDCFFISVAAR
jgi:hypothetical protein